MVIEDKAELEEKPKGRSLSHDSVITRKKYI